VTNLDATWTALEDRCLPPPHPPIRDLADYHAYLATLPERWWCQTTEDKVEYIGETTRGELSSLGTVRHARHDWPGRAGTLILTANSQARMAELEEHIVSAASASGASATVAERSAQTAEELLDISDDPDPAPDSREAMCRRLGVDTVPPEPVTLSLEQHFLPLEEGMDHLAQQISRALAKERFLTTRDEDGLTPAEAVAAGGAARDRVLALIDDCEWRVRSRPTDDDSADMLPDPDELRRRLDIQATSRPSPKGR
jgi:hypothetical protein